jgi:GxxExxY protein
MYSQKKFDADKYPLQNETDQIIGAAIEVHKILGAGFLEIVYKDALEYELKEKGIHYEREKEYAIGYKKVVLPHRFYADFTVLGRIVVEIKARQGGFSEEDTAQTMNYLKCSGCKVGLLLNFGKNKLEIKRIIY